MRRVAVTGLGCVTPVGNNVNDFWQSLIAGRHGIAKITRYDAAGMKAQLAAEVKDFDAEHYMPKTEARKTDLYAQYAIAAAAEAMADCGENAPDPERTGVYVSSGTGGIQTTLNQAEVLITRGAGRISPFFVPMMIVNMASALIAIKFNAKGPCLPVVSACATATHAIGEAFRAIKHGYADLIIAGGAEAAVNPLAMGGFANAQALSLSADPDAASLPFDRRRVGFIMGEGAGIVILEEYTRAKKRGARIYCEISGYGNTCDAYHMTAPHPDAESAARMMRLCMDEAGRDAGENLYINAHGTGTPQNDRTETLAIKKAFGGAAHDITISSTKSMTGHMLGAAGGAEAIAAVKALETGVVAPTIGLCEPDPDCDLNYTPQTAKRADIDAALSVSFGFGGMNAGVLFIKNKAAIL